MDAKPSSGRLGFFQSSPWIANQYLQDESLKRATQLFLTPEIEDAVSQDLTRLGDHALSKQVMQWVSDAERNQPYLRGSGYDTFGNRTESLVTSEGWRGLQALGFQEGIVAMAYDDKYGEYSRVVQFIKYHLWSASSAYVICPSAMQDGAAAVLKDQLAKETYDTQARDVLQDAFARLTTRDPAIGWTSGQWMTERAGGSNVSGTETIATFIGPTEARSADGLLLGPWRIDGFKWFSSATDCSMAILLAKTSKGLSCFFAPTRRLPKHGREETNGILIQRLKSKMGTRALPTAELELEGMRAYLLGEEGKGVKVISSMLNITRVHNAVTAVSLLGRGLAVARSYACERKVGQHRLCDIQLFRKTLAQQFLAYRANILLTYFVVSLLGLSENTKAFKYLPATPLRPQSSEQTNSLLRLLTPITKALTAKASISGLQECIEALGGLGYLENEENQEINIARLFRDANVLSIWEGTTDVMATDTVKVLKGRDSRAVVQALSGWIEHAITPNYLTLAWLQPVVEAVRWSWKSFKQSIAAASVDELTSHGRDVMATLGDIVSSVLLVVDAASDRDEVAKEICLRFAEKRLGLRREKQPWRDASRLDGLIAFGQFDGVPTCKL